jgi:hypothetical protein
MMEFEEVQQEPIEEAQVMEELEVVEVMMQQVEQEAQQEAMEEVEVEVQATPTKNVKCAVRKKLTPKIYYFDRLPFAM